MNFAYLDVACFRVALLTFRPVNGADVSVRAVEPVI